MFATINWAQVFWTMWFYAHQVNDNFLSSGQVLS